MKSKETDSVPVLVPLGSDGGRGSVGRGWGGAFGGFLLMVGVLVLVLAPGAGAQAPAVSSVVPATGATGISINTTLTFQFNVAMDDTIPPAGSAPGVFVGNFEVTPEEASSSFSCSWSADGRSLACEAFSDLPEETLITWRLNPARSILPFKSAAGVALPTAFGSFRTGTGTGTGGGGDGDGDGIVPVLSSSNPAVGATGVPVTGNVVFVFDIPMQPHPQIGGVPPFVKGAISWSGTGLDATKFSYAWSADGKTLTCEYSGDLPGTTQISWTLNPADTLIPLQSMGEEPLALTSGGFTTGVGSTTGGNGCDPDGVPDGWGAYGVSKNMEFEQDASGGPRPQSESAFMFGALVSSPKSGPLVTAASLSVAGAAAVNLSNAGLGGLFFLSRETATEDLLNSAYPGGAYTLRFQASGQAEQVVTMSMPANNPPTPRVANFSELTGLDPKQPFTLRWDAFTGALPGDMILLSITTGTNTVFSAPDPCVPRALAVADMSIQIPANTFETGRTYEGTLSFDRIFYSNTNSIPNMSGFGAAMKSTHFTFTLGGGAVGEAARFVAWAVQPDGSLLLTFLGTPARVYTIQRSPTPASGAWTPLGTGITDASGRGVFLVPNPAGASPSFFRAASN